MTRLKLMTILGTRPEIIRLSAVMRCADKYFHHIMVHTGQNYDPMLNQIFFDELGLRAPDYYLDTAGENLGETMGNIITKTYRVMLQEKPDAVLILGDTNSALSAISAKRLKIPIFHMEAGNRCWDWNVSEMINRKIVDHIADINLPYTENSRRYLLAEGMDGKTIFVTGSPMREVLEGAMQSIRKSNVLEKMNLTPKNYILVSAHREENIDIEANFFSLMQAINHMAETYQCPVIYSTHPRSRKFIKLRNFTFHPLVTNIDPLGFFDYNQLQMNSLVVLSDSGTLSEESAILGFCGVLIRTSTERPEVLDKGSIVIGGITQDSVLQASQLAIALQKSEDIPPPLPADYQDLNVSTKIIRLIQSYTPIVNQTVWQKI